MNHLKIPNLQMPWCTRTSKTHEEPQSGLSVFPDCDSNTEYPEDKSVALQPHQATPWFSLLSEYRW